MSASFAHYLPSAQKTTQTLLHLNQQVLMLLFPGEHLLEWRNSVRSTKNYT